VADVPGRAAGAALVPTFTRSRWEVSRQWTQCSPRAMMVPRQIIVPAAVVTKDNVDKYEEYAFN
jgi:hypothetical protein